MPIIDLFQIVELKKEIEFNFGIKMHMHDLCSTQYFTFDKNMSKKLKEFITKYFSKLNYNVAFGDDNKSFYLE